ncbi:hypothetical protein [Methanonatronarchaeum sp. AMET6-2]|uniref:hypothetical protein n=1 Tax=Methanonatronarchaeum sp. AMET6-2 TaxID=2933293 RepID=UPI0011FC8AA3|nr:hypothetical protein [Methanonatronarchaeum sp. AMET6-2]RZN61121.1 MAG: hypothetical protein EF811_05320 [Methanonatronarchaeia archaeon]UOY09821.1 hypothetical protein MU439_06055 [Methanonatronarchaeum sp. AMET6-2]
MDSSGLLGFDRGCIAVSSKAEVDSVEGVEENLEFYREKGFDFVPIPSEGLYYCVESNEFKELSSNQVLSKGSGLLDAVGYLEEYPFVLVEADEGFFIITIADLNKRCVREAVYPLIVELERSLSDLIIRRYPDSEAGELIARLGHHTVGYWFKSKLDGVELHVAEYMSLSEMVNVIKDDKALIKECGFSSKNQFSNHFSGLVDLRNKVMHPNRTLFHSQEDVGRFLGRVKRVKEVLENLDCGCSLVN